MNNWGWQELIQGALVAFFAQGLGDQAAVKAGWVGNAPFEGTKEKAVLAIEALPAMRDVAPAELRSWTTPPTNDPTPETEAIADYGDQIVPVVMNLYVIADTDGKTKRARILKEIEDLWPVAEGRAPIVNLTLSNAEATRAHVSLESVEMMDDPEGLAANEWRALIRLEVRHALERKLTLPYCRTIQLGAEADSLQPVDTIS
ncbi:MAG TPA: hypothetical protein VK181_20500 [Rhizobium sp.]|nr:hypothetical protein [Rhizobium sp.]